jgi:hypothetical protein
MSCTRTISDSTACEWRRIPFCGILTVQARVFYIFDSYPFLIWKVFQGVYSWSCPEVRLFGLPNSEALAVGQ